MITFTLQQALDKVVAHLLNGGVQSVRDTGHPALGGPACLYRGDDGAKCFIGLMIPDDLYNPTWDDPEGAAATASDLCEQGVIDAPSQAMEQLQKIHDVDHHWNNGRNKFSSIGWGALKLWATRYELIYPEDAPNA
tara:strand:+ start:664 stop:1071 length:408 start_codon:yes stop_codon:yes gene_type:complete